MLFTIAKDGKYYRILTNYAGDIVFQEEIPEAVYRKYNR